MWFWNETVYVTDTDLENVKYSVINKSDFEGWIMQDFDEIESRNLFHWSKKIQQNK